MGVQMRLSASLPKTLNLSLRRQIRQKGGGAAWSGQTHGLSGANPFLDVLAADACFFLGLFSVIL